MFTFGSVSGGCTRVIRVAAVALPVAAGAALAVVVPVAVPVVAALAVVAVAWWSVVPTVQRHPSLRLQLLWPLSLHRCRGVVVGGTRSRSSTCGSRSLWVLEDCQVTNAVSGCFSLCCPLLVTRPDSVQGQAESPDSGRYELQVSTRLFPLRQACSRTGPGPVLHNLLEPGGRGFNQ